MNVVGFLLLSLAVSLIVDPVVGQQVTLIESPAGTSSGQPHLDRGVDGIVRMCWVETDERSARLRFSALGVEGWSAPRTIAEGDRWFVNWADVPSLAADGHGNLLAHWLERLGDGSYAYGVRMRISTDEGATWGVPFWIHDDRSAQEHGFCSILPKAKVGQIQDITPGFWVVWLDGRDMPKTDEMTLRARTVGIDGKLGREAVLDPRVCECCPTAIARGGDGLPLMTYRDRSGKDVRDIAVARHGLFGWGKPAILHDDRWTRPG